MQERPVTSDVSATPIAFVAAMLRHWRIGLAITLAGAFVGAACTAYDPPQYEAVASVALVKTRTDVQFDPKIRTLSPDNTAAPTTDSRRNALLGLVQSGSIADAALKQFEGRVSTIDRNPARLLAKVKGEIGQRADLVLIKAQDRDPELAAEIATWWAREYEREVNDIYSGTSDGYSGSITNELERSRMEYETAQRALEDFMANSQIEGLELTVAERNKTLDGLQASRLAFANGALDRAQGLVAQVGALNEAQQRARMLRQLAAAMRAQVRAGGDAAAASNMVPLIQLKLQVFTIEPVSSRAFAVMPSGSALTQDARPGVAPQQPYTGPVLPSVDPIQLQLPGPAAVTTADAQLRDLDALVSALDGLDSDYAAAISAATSAAAQARNAIPAADAAQLNADSDRIITELRDAKSKLERERARVLTLTQTRDLRRNTYTSLASKQAETTISNAVTGSEVRFASEAIAPTRRVNPLWLYTLTGLVAGALLGVLAASGLELWPAARRAARAA